MNPPGTGEALFGLRAWVLATAAMALALAAGSVAWPFLGAWDAPGGPLLYRLYGSLCHQRPDRSLLLGGLPMAACARCTGLYLGGAAGLVLFGLGRVARGPARPRLWFATAVAPTLVDAAAPWVGLPQLSNLPRLLLSVATGVVLGMFLAVGVDDLARMVREPAGSRSGRAAEGRFG